MSVYIYMSVYVYYIEIHPKENPDGMFASIHFWDPYCGYFMWRGEANAEDNP